MKSGAGNVGKAGTARDGGAHRARIQSVAEGVAEEIEPEDGRPDGEPGKDRRPRRVAKLTEVASIGDHCTPTGRRRLHAEAKKGQGRFGDDRAGDAEGRGD